MVFTGMFDGDTMLSIEGNIVHWAHLQLLGNICLYHRDVLGDKLGIRHTALQEYTDALLILRAYQKWKNKMFVHIDGAWAFVLFDTEKKILLLSRDPTENTSLFYKLHNRILYFSSSTHYFKNHNLFHLKINHLEFIKLSLRLIGNSMGKTVINGLFYVLPKEYILFYSSTEFIKFQIPEDPCFRLRYKKEYDYFLQFRSLMADAVHCRLQYSKNPGIFLSSGLDSTTVASFLLKSADTLNAVNTFTHVPLYVDQTDDVERISEEPLVRYFLQDYPKATSSYLSFSNTSFKIEFKEGTAMDLFYPIIHSNSFWLKGIFQQAHQLGVDLLFTGQMGNYTISFRGDEPAITSSIKRTLQYLFTNLFGNFFFKKQQWKYSVIRNEILTKAFKHPILKNAFKIGYAYNSRNNIYRQKTFETIHCFASTHWSFLSQQFNIRVVDPTSDKILQRFLNAIPQNIFFRDGIPKYLLKKSMAGHLPEKILMNRFPKPQSADIGTRLKKEDFLTDIVDHLVNKYQKSSFFDIEKLKKIHRQLIQAHSKQQQHVLGFHLLYMISIIKCYEHQHSKTN